MEKQKKIVAFGSLLLLLIVTSLNKVYGKDDIERFEKSLVSLFPQQDARSHYWASPSFQTLPSSEKFKQVNETLLELIEQTPSPCFLLPNVLDFIEKTEQAGALAHFSLTHFELWLNSCPDISIEKNREIRGKIMGKYLPRFAFETSFPLGRDKIYPGSHWVTAHTSPDIDTLVASFWGWADAFSARVSSGIHLWNVPGSIPTEDPVVDFLFSPLLGKSSAAIGLRSRTSLPLRAIDLIDAPFIDQESAPISCIDYWEAIDNPSDLQGFPIVVTQQEKEGCFPLGLITGKPQKTAATISLRDFSNREETNIPAYMEILSVIDHHKSSLKTKIPAILCVADVQSANTLCAEQALYSYEIWQKRIGSSAYFIDSQRKEREYLHYLVAISDDTDMLKKAGMRDLMVVQDLLHQLGRQPKDVLPWIIESTTELRHRVLQNPTLTALYQKLSEKRISRINENCMAAADQTHFSLFSDTKEFYGYARIGMSKLFPENRKKFEGCKASILLNWIEEARCQYKQSESLDMHMQSFITIGDLPTCLEDQVAAPMDELWIWIPKNSMEAQKKLRFFLNDFLAQFDFWEERTQDDCLIFRFPVGALDSRKTQIVPFLLEI